MPLTLLLSCAAAVPPVPTHGVLTTGPTGLTAPSLAPASPGWIHHHEAAGAAPAGPAAFELSAPSLIAWAPDDGDLVSKATQRGRSKPEFVDARLTLAPASGLDLDLYFLAGPDSSLDVSAAHPWSLDVTDAWLAPEFRSPRSAGEASPETHAVEHRVAATTRGVRLGNQGGVSSFWASGYDVVIAHRDGTARYSASSTPVGGPLAGLIDQAAPPAPRLFQFVADGGDLDVDFGEAPVALLAPTVRAPHGFRFEEATGVLVADGREFAFDHQPLEVGGDFQVSPVPSPGDERVYAVAGATPGSEAAPVTTRWTGQLPPWVWVAGAAGAAAAAAALLWSPAGGLFTRLLGERVLGQPERNRLLLALGARPGATAAELAALGRCTEKNVRYHLRVLLRHGKIRSLRLSGAARFFLAGHDVRDEPARVAMAEDGRVAALAAKLSGRARHARELVTDLRREFGLSRSGAWKLLDRAALAGVVKKQRSGRTVTFSGP